MAKAVARGLVAEPPEGSRGRDPGQGVRGLSPSEAESSIVSGCPTDGQKCPFLVFCSV